VSAGWSAPDLPDPTLQAAADAAAKADVAVVVVGDTSSEGSDRTTLALPGNEDDLISAVAAANPRTVVVLRAGAPVLMPWLSQVPAVLDMWYPGQEDGNALAALLTGDAEPGGRLPVSFPRTDTQTAVAAAPGRYPAVNGVYDYSEGLDVGYRWYQQEDQTPLFPFGYGLSYTTFRVSHLSTGPGSVQATSRGTGQVHLSVDVTNTGRRTGTDVVQVYLGYPKGSGEPPKSLKTFAKVQLKPGQTKKVRLTLSSDALRVWDSSAHDWTVLDGRYPLYVGQSSADTPLTGAVTVSRTVGAQYVALAAAATTDPGTAQSVKQTFTNTGDSSAQNVRLGLTLPKGWTATPAGHGATTFRSVRPHSSVSVPWNVTAPATTAAGAVTLTGTAAFELAGRQTRSATATTTVPYATTAAAYDNEGISADSDPSTGNLDPGGYSYSATQLAAVGYTPGATVTANGLSYAWPNTRPGAPDNIAAAGQVIKVQGKGARIGLLGTGVGSAHSGTVTVTYTDGTTADLTVDFPDWYGNAASGNSQLAVTTANWNRPASDTLGNHAVSLYTTGGTLDPSKTVSTVTLPDDTGIHVFAISVS
jgi:beta-glucosidase